MTTLSLPLPDHLRGTMGIHVRMAHTNAPNKYHDMQPTLCMYPAPERAMPDMAESQFAMEKLWEHLTDDDRAVVLAASLLDRHGQRSNTPPAITLTSPAGVKHICAVWADEEVWVELPTLAGFCPYADGYASRGFYS